MLGASLRNLLVVATTFGQLIDPGHLWTEFSSSMCDDLRYKLQQLFPDNSQYTDENDELFHQGSPVLDYGLFLIDGKLRDLGHLLEEYQLPKYKHNWYEALRSSTSAVQSTNALINEQLSYDINHEANLFTSRYISS